MLDVHTVDPGQPVAPQVHAIQIQVASLHPAKVKEQGVACLHSRGAEGVLTCFTFQA